MRCALLVLLLQPLIASADPPSDTVSNSTSLADVSTREAGLTRAGLLPDGWIDPRGTVAVDTSGVILVGTANLRAVPIEGIELSASIDWNIISDEESVPDRIERVTLRGRLWSSPRVSIAAMASGGSPAPGSARSGASILAAG